MQLSKAGYYADFVVYPLLILGLLMSRFIQAGEWRPFMFMGLCLIGFAAWTLFEYLLHRYVLHRVPILHDMHEVHHADPAAFVGTPSWASSLFFLIGALLPLWWGLGFPFASALTAGLMFGYLCYVGVHHATHHWRLMPGSFLYRWRHRHARHHFAEAEGNYGVTTDFWDWVFGTRLERARLSSFSRLREKVPSPSGRASGAPKGKLRRGG
jgi:sterol desaturase/sphingolipid hydroxylase (fatty acid hydroxylase superfamily)